MISVDKTIFKEILKSYAATMKYLLSTLYTYQQGSSLVQEVLFDHSEHASLSASHVVPGNH